MPDPTSQPVGAFPTTDYENPADIERLSRGQFREKVRGLFSQHPEVRADAIDALKKAWAYDDPSFRLEELANMPSDNCVIAAARRDGHKEILAWLFSIR